MWRRRPIMQSWCLQGSSNQHGSAARLRAIIDAKRRLSEDRRIGVCSRMQPPNPFRMRTIRVACSVWCWQVSRPKHQTFVERFFFEPVSQGCFITSLSFVRLFKNALLDGRSWPADLIYSEYWPVCSLCIYRVAQKSKPLPIDQKIVLKPVSEIIFIRQIKVWIKHHNFYSLSLDIICVTYFLTSITITDPQTSDMHQIW